MKERLSAWATGHPLDLAVFRITASVVVLASADVWDARLWAGAVLKAPPGWQLVSSVLPVTPLAASIVLVVVVVSASFTLVGAFSRVSSAVTALGLVWLLGVPQQSGLVLHTHHLWWLMALVATGPSGDALSLDAWWAKRRGRALPGPSVAHGLPVRVAWLSIGLVFFFPGVWKLVSGAAWLEGLPTLVAWKRFQLGLPRLEVEPAFLRAGGVATIVFELGVTALLVFRRTRLLGVALALAFHLGVQWVLGIRFSSLWSCYLVFLPWSRWLGLSEVPLGSSKAPALSLGFGVALLSAQVVTGVLGIEGAWPVACYPTFRHPAPTTVAWVELETSDGLVLSPDRMRSGPNQRWWGLSEQAAWDPSSQRLAGLFTQVMGRPPRDGERVVWTRVTVDLATGVTRRALPGSPARSE